MIGMTPTPAPAALAGPGALGVRPVSGPGLCAGLAPRAVARIAAFTAPSQGTGLPAGSAVARLRAVTPRPVGHVVVSGAGLPHSEIVDNNGITLGYHSSRRPES